MNMHGGKRKGAGRKPSENSMVMFYVRVPVDLKEALDRLGAQWVRDTLTEATKKEKPP